MASPGKQELITYESKLDMILLLIVLPCGDAVFRSVHLMHYTIKNDKQMMLYLGRLSFFFVTLRIDGFSWTTGANYYHITVRHDIVIDELTMCICLFQIS